VQAATAWLAATSSPAIPCHPTHHQADVLDEQLGLEVDSVQAVHLGANTVLAELYPHPARGAGAAGWWAHVARWDWRRVVAGLA